MKKPSQDPAPGVKGGGAPASPNVGGPVRDALPVEEGWVSKAVRWLRENVEFFGMSDEAGRVLWLLLSIISAMVFGYILAALVV